MGNHELNAIHFHTNHPETGKPLREHSEKNIRQHASFLNEFQHGSAEAVEIISWMCNQPVYRELQGFRIVHACWHEKTVETLSSLTHNGTLSPEQIVSSADVNHQLFELVETTTKGPEVPLPHGFSFFDKDGTTRSHVRVQWWRGNAKQWRDIAMSVPDNNQLPDTDLPSEIINSVYPNDAKPVFFGHYWMTGEPVLQSQNALCLDYSAGKDGPLLAYLIEDEFSHTISLNNILGASE